MGPSRSRQQRVLSQEPKLYLASILVRLMLNLYLYPNNAFRHPFNPVSWSFCSPGRLPFRDLLFEQADDLKVKSLLHRAVIQGIGGYS